MCEILQLFSVVFCVVRAVGEFEFELWLLATEGKTTSYSDRHMLLTGYVSFPPAIFASARGLYPRCPGKLHSVYRGADKSLAQPGRKQATATEDFEFRIYYL